MKELATIPQTFPSIPEEFEARPVGHADIREIDAIPLPPLKKMLGKIDHAWWDSDVRHNLYRNHATTRCIRLRHVTDYNFNDIQLINFPELASTFKPEIDEVLSVLSASYEYCDFTAMILLLPSGARIEPHVDQGRWFRLAHRIHVPLVTNPDVEFRVGTERVNMKVGKAYEIDNANKIHAVVNNGSRDRVHLVIDLLPFSTLMRFPLAS
jgi:hypothetical protein